MAGRVKKRQRERECKPKLVLSKATVTPLVKYIFEEVFQVCLSILQISHL